VPKEIVCFAEKTYIAEASTLHVIIDPGNLPADSHALRNDLVASAISDIVSDINAIGTRMNSTLSAFEAADILLFGIGK
jgi:hypothetical protein